MTANNIKVDFPESNNLTQFSRLVLNRIHLTGLSLLFATGTKIGVAENARKSYYNIERWQREPVFHVNRIRISECDLLRNTEFVNVIK